MAICISLMLNGSLSVYKLSLKIAQKLSNVMTSLMIADLNKTDLCQFRNIFLQKLKAWS